MEIKDLTSDRLEAQIETFKDRIETIKEYISDEDDGYTRSNMETQLYRYNLTLRALTEEKRLRLKYGERRDQIEENFAVIKEQILEKFNPKIPYHASLYRTINSITSIDQLLGELTINSRHYNTFGLMNKEFLSQFPEDMLSDRKIYIEEENVEERNGISIFIDSQSKHYGNSESYHYGRCSSEHFDRAESYHHDHCTSEHWNNTRSVHFHSAKSVHHDQSEPQQYGEAICTRV